MEKMKEFVSETFGSLHAFEHRNDVWFLGIDVLGLLGFPRTDGALKKFVKEEDIIVLEADALRRLLGGDYSFGSALWVDKDGLYSLLSVYRNELSDAVRSWVESEVLPVVGSGFVSLDRDTGLQLFENSEFGRVRSVVLDGEPWFVAKDIATALGFRDTNKSVAEHVDDDDKLNVKNSSCGMGRDSVAPSEKSIFILDKLNRKQYPVFINESGFYSLVFGSKLPSAKRFRKWVTSEVLPVIRRNGIYMSAPFVDEYRNAPEVFSGRVDRMEEMMRTLKGMEASLDELKSENRDIKLLNSELRDRNNGLNKRLLEMDSVISGQEKRIRFNAMAYEFTKVYGMGNEARPISFYAQDFGLSPQTMNLVLVSFGVMYERRTKGKNLHRYALGSWRSYVRQGLRYLNIGKGNKEKVKVIDVNLSSPCWLPGVLPLWCGLFASYGLLGKDGKFDKDLWERRKEAEKRRCKKEKKEMRQAWALDVFGKKVLAYEDMDVPLGRLPLAEPPKMEEFRNRDGGKEDDRPAFGRLFG